LPRRVILWQMRACWSLAGSASQRAAPRCSTSASASACRSVGSPSRPSAGLLATRAHAWAAESNFSWGLAKQRPRRAAGPLRLLAPARAAGQGADRPPGCAPGSGLVALALPAAVPVLPAAGVLHQHRPVLAGLGAPAPPCKEQARRHSARRAGPGAQARCSGRRRPQHRPRPFAHAAACALCVRC